MRRLLALFSVIVAVFAVSATAQESDTGDRSRLVSFIEEQLSDGAARQVRIEGFRGALSSSASLDVLTISDSAGVWLILEGAQLDWNRSALFSRALDVQSLTAERLVVLRQPEAEDNMLPPAEATPFALPQLPLTVDVDQIAIDRLELGASLVGQDAAFRLEGSASLADGAGEADVSLSRLDGPTGLFDLDAAYANATGALSVDLEITEAEGGIASDLLGIPGQPAIGLRVSGAGSIDDISLDAVFTSDGEPRVTGSITSRSDAASGNRRVLVDVTGDLLPVLDEGLHPFFGQRSVLRAQINQVPGGATTITDLLLETEAMEISGAAGLDADGQPRFLDVVGTIGEPDAQTLTPLPGGNGTLTVRNARFELAYDAAAGERFVFDAGFNDLALDGVALDRTTVTVEGDVTSDREGAARVVGAIVADIEGIDIDDPAHAEAIGDAATMRGDFVWATGEPFTFPDLRIALGEVSLSGPVTLDVNDGRAALAVDWQAVLPRLTRFAAVAGQPLEGAAGLALTGEVDLLSGAFDAAFNGTATNLVVSPAVPRSLFAGETDFVISARRDETGLLLRQLDLDGGNLSLSATGALTSRDGQLAATARLNDLALFTDTIGGPARIDLDLRRDDAGPWVVEGAAEGPAGLGTRVSGTITSQAGTVDLRFLGNAPLAIANGFVQPRSIDGTASYDLTLRGAPALDAVSGRVQTTGARFSAPTFQAALEDIDATVSLANGRAEISAVGNWSTGGRVSANGGLDLGGAQQVDVSIALESLRVVDPALYELVVDEGALRLTGPLTRQLRLGGDITLGASEIRVPEAQIGGAAPVPPIDFTAETAAQRRTRLFAGFNDTDAGTAGRGSGAGDGVALDIGITAPGRVFLRGRGIDAEFGGEIRLSGTSGNILPNGRFDLVRGRIDVLGTRLDITEGAVTLQGASDPFLRVRAESHAGAYRIFVTLDGPASDPQIGFSSSPELPEDEVLAQLLFGRTVGSLSPVQLLQLADAVTSLAGGGRNAAFLTELREGLGLDDLDLQTDAEGNAVVRAGRYISENIYSDVTIGADGDADVSLNIDLTPNITARGQVSDGGESSVGIFFERDY